MRILIADDEPLARRRLSQLLDGQPEHEVVGEAGNGIQVVEQVEALQPDVVLLDIRMPGMDGLEAGRHLSRMSRPPAIIFTTAYGEYALDAFDTHAVGYLLKPVREEKLDEALGAARKLSQAQVKGVTDNEERSRSHICARVRGNLKLIPLETVYYFKADSKYVEVHHQEGEVLIEESLKSLEDEFGNQLLRIHRNALISPSWLEGLDKDDKGRTTACFKGINDRLEISRRHLPRVRALLKGQL